MPRGSEAPLPSSDPVRPSRWGRRLGAKRNFSYLMFAALFFFLTGATGCTPYYPMVICAGIWGIYLPPNLKFEPKGWIPPGGAVAHRVLAAADGSTTGTAEFQGAFTTISQPGNAYFLMERLRDCSLNLMTATTDLTGTITLDGLTPHFEKTLHQLASLTTKSGVWAKGCNDPNIGIGSRPGVLVGQSKQGVGVFATTFNATGNSVILTLGVSSDLSNVTSRQLTSLPHASALTTADLNGDGNGDLVVVNGILATKPTISVLLGNADGTFKSPVSYATAGHQSIAAVVDDVNGDGKFDIVVVSDDQHLSVLLGKGNGTFEAAKSFALPPLPGQTSTESMPVASLITAELRTTGKNDIVCSNGLVLLNDGKGNFTAAEKPAFPYAADFLSSAGPNLASGDLNKDGKLDLVLSYGNVISTWVGKGDGTFTPGHSYVSISNTGYVTVTDLDGDGNPDIYTGLANGGLYTGDDSSNASAYALMGKGDGTFQGLPMLSSGSYTGNNLGDVTGSGKLDLITNGVVSPNGYTGDLSPTFTVQLLTGTGTFKPVSTITAPASFMLNGETITGANAAISPAYAVGDINGDGKADLVFLSGVNTRLGLPVYFTALSKGDGTFQTPVPHAFPQLAPASDFDIALTVSNLQITPLKHGGPAALAFNFNEIAGGSVAIAKPYNQGLVVLPGNGNGTFTEPPVIISTLSSTTAPNPNFLPVTTAIADINGDGNPDLVVIDNTYVNSVGPTSKLEVYLGKGNGTFKAPVVVKTPANPTSVVLADFNHDGKLDLGVVCGAINAEFSQIAIALGKGDGTFDEPKIMTIASDINGGATLAAGDFNDDGHIDIALFNPYGVSGIYYGNGNGTFESVNTGSTSQPVLSPKDLIDFAIGGSATAVNLIKGGKPDILVGNAVLLNVYGSAPTITIPADTAVTLATSAAKITAGKAVTFTAQVSVDGSTVAPTGAVTFYSGTTVLGTSTLSKGKATYATKSLPVGTLSISAIYNGTIKFAAQGSPIVTETVTKAP